MPVTARLSKAFYDRFGEQLTNELVDWFNQVDATYRSDLRELNEINFARFDAKLEQRISEVKAEISRFDGRLEQRIAEVKAEITRLEERMDLHFKAIAVDTDLRFKSAASQTNHRFETVATQADLAALRAELIKWMFLFWVGTVVPILGVVLALR
jgi:hypothetical protein